MLQPKFIVPSHSSKSHVKSFPPPLSMDSCLSRLTETQWNEILHCSTEILSSSSAFLLTSLSSLPTYSLHDLKDISLTHRHSPLFIQAIYLLHLTQQFSPAQSYLSGYRNIWIVKAPEASKGTNIKLFCSLAEIMLYEKGMSGRIVQKYIERPLLIPLARVAATATPRLISNPKSVVKFDLRIWVLVTSFTPESPPQVYIYEEVYGRRCSSSFNLSRDSLNDLFRHLTNYSIQKSRVKDESSDHEVDDQIGDLRDNDMMSSRRDSSSSSSFNEGVKLLTSKVNQLRSTVQNYRSTSCRTPRGGGGGGGAGGPTLTSSDLLVTHEELMSYLTSVQHSTVKWKQLYPPSLPATTADSIPPAATTAVAPYLWSHCIWPRIQEKIFSLITKAQSEIISRENSFEFLGIDVLLDDRCDPWILEVNLTPGLSHRNPNHNQYIERMATELVDTVLEDFGVHSSQQQRESGKNESPEFIARDKEKKRFLKGTGKWKLIRELLPQHKWDPSQTQTFPDPRWIDILGVLKSQHNVLRSYFPKIYLHPRLPCPSTSAPVHHNILIPSSPLSQGIPFTSQLDIAFTLNGIAVTKSQILFADLCCDKFMSLLLIQRYLSCPPLSLLTTTVSRQLVSKISSPVSSLLCLANPQFSSDPMQLPLPS
jgi:hypothetical protein